MTFYLGVNVSSKSNKQKNLEKIVFSVGIFKVRTKIAGSDARSISPRHGSGFGSVPVCYGSATLPSTPEHWTYCIGTYVCQCLYTIAMRINNI